MPRQALKGHLEELRRELADPGNLDDEMRQELAGVADAIEQLLHEESPNYREAHANIEDAALRFEASHPAFARIMGELTDTLAKLGI